jgi:fumarate hydratase subunit alpha
MRQIEVAHVTQAVKAAAIAANYEPGVDLLEALTRGLAAEESPSGKEIFRQLLENARIAEEERIPMCQDCGLAVIFAEVGQDVHLVGGDFAQAINEGVRQGYGEGYLRKSLCHPLTRANTGDNTPAVIHTEIVPGDRLKLIVVPKGGGSENMSRLYMLKPADGLAGIKEKVVTTVAEAGPNPCRPRRAGGPDYRHGGACPDGALPHRLAAGGRQHSMSRFPSQGSGAVIRFSILDFRQEKDKKINE